MQHDGWAEQWRSEGGGGGGGGGAGRGHMSPGAGGLGAPK